MATERCTCCDLPVEACGKAAAERERRERKALRQQALRLPGVVAARFPGTCPACGGKYLQGAPIMHSEDGWRGVLCCLPLDV